MELLRLFTPLRLRGMLMRNRINLAPMVTNYATIGGEVTDRLIEYYAARARGGAGLITVEATVVSHDGRSFSHNLCLHQDRHVPGLRRLAEAVHDGGACISVEIYHAGRRTTAAIARSQPVSASAIAAKGGEVPYQLSPARIRQLQDDFVRAALRAREAGCDAVTVHAAHGYLINAFLSPHSNHRRDAYGGDARGRARFGLEIVERIRVELGPDFPIIVRVSGTEFIDGGLTLEGTRQAAVWFVEAGADAIDVSAGTIETGYMTNLYMMYPRGVLVPLAAGIKEAVSVPVFAVGRINDPVLAEQILAEGKADAITMGRALIADPELPNKAREGRSDEICPCIACNQGCTDRLGLQLDVACLVNPAAGRESYVHLRPAERSRRVLVVGGGIAGMQAALAASRRGHEVELHERDERLGGQFHLAGASPGKKEILGFIAYLERQVAASSVRVHLGSELTAERIDELAPEAVVVATGARPLVPPVPGVEHAARAWDVLAGKTKIGGRVVMIGGGQVGCETAEVLAEAGAEVTILEMLPEMAGDMGPRAREPFLHKLIDLGVNFITRAKVTAIAPREVTYDRHGLLEKILNLDAVVLAVGSTADTGLAEALRAGEYDLHVVGDCVKSRRGLEAIHEGFAAGNAV